MAQVIADRVQETTTTTGTGALALGGAVTGYQAFSAVCSVNDTVYYAIEAVDGNGVATGDWEVGLGTYSAANTLTRTTPAASSNSGSAVNLAAGTKRVWIDASAGYLGLLAPKASPAFTGAAGFADGTVSAPSIAWTSDQDGTGTGFYRRFANSMTMAFNGVIGHEFDANGISMPSTFGFRWWAGASPSTPDTVIARAAANSVIFTNTGVSTKTTSRTEINKAVTAFTDAVAKSTFTVTIPNGAHSGTLIATINASMGAGGAIGANEASYTITYPISISRVAGVNAVAVIGTGILIAASNVAGADALLATAAVSAIAGAVGATNTFTLDVTISKVGVNAEDNHTAELHGVLHNHNAGGITIA